MSITVISGGTQGLGEAIGRKLAQADDTDGLLLVGRTAERGIALAAELSADGVPTHFLRADVTEDPGAVIEACVERFGTIHNLVNVAATTTRASIFTDTPDHFDRQFAVNTKAPYFLIQAAARVMVDHGHPGSIVNLGSVAGHGGQPKLTAYAASKGALTVITKNLAYALMRHNIRVNQINPGWMDTESEHRTQVEQDGAPEDWLVAAEAGRPWGRLVKPWEVANLVAFCLSEQAGMLTGACIDVDQSVQGGGDPPMPSWEETPTPTNGSGA